MKRHEPPKRRTELYLDPAGRSPRPARVRTRRSRRVQDCRVKLEAERFFAQGRSLLATMRRLRLEMRHCPDCPQSGDCPLLQHFNEQAAQAVAEITEEFNLREV